MPAAPAPTMTTSIGPETATAAKAGRAKSTAEAAKNDRRLNCFMVKTCFLFN
jgi:hypothetical protein